MHCNCEVYSDIGIGNEYTFSSIGPGASVVGQLVGNDFQFNSIFAGPGISVTQPGGSPGPIVISAGSFTNATLQSAYDNGQDINMTSGPISITGTESVDFTNNFGIQINNGVRNYMYNETGGTFVDQDVVLNWPNASFNGFYNPATSIVHYDFTFLGYETTTGESFTAKLQGRYDASTNGLNVSTIVSNTIVDIDVAINSGLEFTLLVLNGVEYNISWTSDIKIINKV